MAIVKCSECQGMVSDKAEFCPHCGLPINLIFKSNLTISKDVKKRIANSPGRIGWHMAMLDNNGRVFANGFNSNGQCDVSEWYDIVEISAGQGYTLGLKADGTVYYTGCNDYGQQDITKLKGIKSISAGYNHSVALMQNGTVIATGNNDCGQCNVSSWEDIIAIETGYENTFGVTKDGQVLFAGSGEYPSGYVSNNWCNIKNIVEYDGFIVGIKKDGSIITTQKPLGYSRIVTDTNRLLNLKGISSLTLLNHCVVGVTESGSIITIGLSECEDDEIINAVEKLRNEI